MLPAAVLLFAAIGNSAPGQSYASYTTPAAPDSLRLLPPVERRISWQQPAIEEGARGFAASPATSRLMSPSFEAPRMADVRANQQPEYTPHEELPPGALYDVMPPPSYALYTAYDDTLGPSIRVFEPKARVYFDTGFEAPGKLDIFHDGSLAPSINFLELYWARQWIEGIGHPDWRWGPNIGVGISSSAGDSVDGSAQASGAPVLLVSYGFLFEFPLTTRQIDALREDPAYGPAAANSLRRLAPKAGIEFGYALGVSSDETLDYSADGALYVGVSLHVLP